MAKINWSLVWVKVSFGARWGAFRAYRAATGGSLAQFAGLGPYVRCTWLDVVDCAELGR